jgi:hypothetical protein
MLGDPILIVIYIGLFRALRSTDRRPASLLLPCWTRIGQVGDCATTRDRQGKCPPWTRSVERISGLAWVPTGRGKLSRQKQRIGDVISAERAFVLAAVQWTELPFS